MADGASFHGKPYGKQLDGLGIPFGVFENGFL